MANPAEIATLIVNGKEFTDWTSVTVESRWADWFPIFTFESTEESPQATSLKALQFAPGDVVQIELAGFKAVFGYITERHTGYEAHNHGIRLIGTGRTSDLTNSTPPLDKMGNHDGKTWSQLATDLVQHLGITIVKKGSVDDEPFEQIQVQPGETISACLERYARMRKIVIGSTENGELLAIGDHSATTTDFLVEGENILRANCVIKDENVYRRIYAIGQQNANDDHSGDQTTKQIAQVLGSSSITTTRSGCISGN